MITAVRNLWCNVISAENISVAASRALKNKYRTTAIHRFVGRRPSMQRRLRQDLIAGRFHTGRYVHHKIYEPKPRDIYVLPFYPDRIVHHALVGVLSPIWDNMFIRDSYSCRVGRGIHAASRRIAEFVRKNKFCLQCDISKFYPNINHTIMYELVCKSLGVDVDTKSPLLDLIHDIIFSVGGGRNMPIGNLTSQWFGNLYLHELDMFVKNVLRVPYYVRYCDDFVLFSNDKAQLHIWRDRIREFLDRRLELHFSYAEIFPVSNGVDFCGYRHFPRGILLRRQTLKRMRRRIKAINQVPLELRRQSPQIRGQIASMHGWSKHSHSRLTIPKI